MKIGLIKTVVIAATLLSFAVSSRADRPKLFDQREFNCADFAESVNYYVDLGETAATADFTMRGSEYERYGRGELCSMQLFTNSASTVSIETLVKCGLLAAHEVEAVNRIGRPDSPFANEMAVHFAGAISVGITMATASR